MQKKKPLVWIALILALGLLTAACSDDKKDDTTTDDTSADSGAYKDLSGDITGTGASFPDAFYQGAIDEFSKVSDLGVTYNAVGSGQGKANFKDGLNDFAGSDSKVKDGEIATDAFLYVPTVAAPITVSYNLPAVKDLQLSADTLAKIFQAEITRWDDAAIKADNPDATLPAKAITIVKRSDGSGTTSNFTKYLAKASTDWKLGSGDTVAWPTSAKEGAKNTGVAQAIGDTEGAIGYVDLSDAKASELTFAAIENKAGEYVGPTLEGASAALAGATVDEDLSYDPLDATGAGAYPIASPTYLLVHTKYSDATKLANVKGFITFLLTEGQDLAASLDFAKLPDTLREKALAQLDKPTVG